MQAYVNRKMRNFSLISRVTAREAHWWQFRWLSWRGVVQEENGAGEEERREEDESPGDQLRGVWQVQRKILIQTPSHRKEPLNLTNHLETALTLNPLPEPDQGRHGVRGQGHWSEWRFTGRYCHYLRRTRRLALYCFFRRVWLPQDDGWKEHLSQDI